MLPDTLLVLVKNELSFMLNVNKDAADIIDIIIKEVAYEYLYNDKSFSFKISGI